ncbi:hypothetical protein [Psychromarinibacter sp. S121]|uniref:hypothetical protein n=1 Tax=Psychromarinibacter sp. S121 TaxID=3415127 RepID=UPI003C7DE5F4
MEDEKTALAGELALGLLEGEERTRALRLVESDPDLRMAMMFWNERLVTLCDEDEAPEVRPPARVQRAIETSLWGEAVMPRPGFWDALFAPENRGLVVAVVVAKAALLGWIFYLFF